MPIIVSPSLASTGVVILDPPAVATNRTALSLNDDPDGAIRVDQQGLDWGDAAIQAYMADARWGSSPVDFRVPNRVVKIPLFVGANDGGQPAFDTASTQLRQKVGLLQGKGGWLQRGSDLPMYADIVDATLTFPDTLGEYAGLQPNVVLTLTCLPDFYGTEVTLDTLTGTGSLASKLKLTGADAVLQGDYPARGRIKVTETSGWDQHGLLWGIRSDHYDSAATAALTYEAEALTPLNGATVTSLVGASGNSMVTLTGIPTGSWTAMLATTIASGSQPLTHTGSYRVWARCYSTTGGPALRLLWGVGSLSTPVTNDATAAIPGAGSFYLMDLGTVRLDAPPVGTNQWFGAIQVYDTAAGHDFSLDELYLQPLDEGAGKLTYVNVPPVSSIQATGLPATAADDAGVGTVAWSNPANAEAQDFAEAIATLSAVGRTHWLKLTNFGFSIPSTATILGIQETHREGASTSVISGNPVTTSVTHVRLVRAGTVEPTEKTGFTTVEVDSGTFDWTTGGPTDLWSAAWTPADINSTGFGWVISHEVTAMSGGVLQFSWGVDSITLTVYYQLASGFIVAQDAVIYANQTAELRTDGMYRSDSTGLVYGDVSDVEGDLPRLPPSGLESRPVELFLKPTRGDFGSLPDLGLNGLSAQVIYRPTWLSRP